VEDQQRGVGRIAQRARERQITAFVSVAHEAQMLLPELGPPGREIADNIVDENEVLHTQVTGGA